MLSISAEISGESSKSTSSECRMPAEMRLERRLQGITVAGTFHAAIRRRTRAQFRIDALPLFIGGEVELARIGRRRQIAGGSAEAHAVSVSRQRTSPMRVHKRPGFHSHAIALQRFEFQDEVAGGAWGPCLRLFGFAPDEAMRCHHRPAIRKPICQFACFAAVVPGCVEREEACASESPARSGVPPVCEERRRQQQSDGQCHARAHLPRISAGHSQSAATAMPTRGWRGRKAGRVKPITRAETRGAKQSWGQASSLRLGSWNWPGARRLHAARGALRSAALHGRTRRQTPLPYLSRPRLGLRQRGAQGVWQSARWRHRLAEGRTTTGCSAAPCSTGNRRLSRAAFSRQRQDLDADFFHAPAQAGDRLSAARAGSIHSLAAWSGARATGSRD